jgi:transposase
MQVKTILNQCHRFKCFVYDKVRCVIDNGERLIEVTVVARRNSQAILLCCGRPAPLYDRLNARRFEFIPLWGYRVFLVYVMRRVECAYCGVKVKPVPWARGKHELTDTTMQFLANWAKKLSWQEVAVSFRIRALRVRPYILHIYCCVLLCIGRVNHLKLTSLESIEASYLNIRE